MARPRINREIRLSSGDGTSYQPDRLPISVVTPREADEYAKQINRIRPRVLAGYRSAASQAMVLDAIMRMEHDHTFNSFSMTDFLNRHYPAFLWNAKTVGRILALIEFAQEGNLPDGVRAIEKTVTGRRVDYRVNVSPSNWLWLSNLRKALGEQAERDLALAAMTGKVIPMDEVHMFNLYDSVKYEA